MKQEGERGGSRIGQRESLACDTCLVTPWPTCRESGARTALQRVHHCAIMGCMLPQGSVWPWGRWPFAAEAVPDAASSWRLSTARICHSWSISTSEKGDLGDTSLYLSYRSIFGKSNKIQGTHWGHECVQSRNPESKEIRKQNRELKNKSTPVWSTDLWQGC